MKKLVSLLVAVVLVLGLATVAFAADSANELAITADQATQNAPYELTAADLEKTIKVTIPGYDSVNYAPGSVFFTLPDEAQGYTVKAVGSEAFELGQGWQNTAYADPTNTATLTINEFGGFFSPNSLSIYNSSDNETEFVITFAAPALGSKGKPDALVVGGQTTVVSSADQAYSYYYTYTAEVGGTLTLSVNEASASYYINAQTSTYETYTADNFETNLNQINVPLASGDSVTIRVIAAEMVGFNNMSWDYMGDGNAASVAFTCSFEAAAAGSYLNPITIEVTEKPAEIELSAGKIYKLTNIEQAIMTIADANVVVSEHYSASYSVDTTAATDSDGDDTILTIASPYSDEMVISVNADCKASINMPIGFAENPEVVETIESNALYIENGIYYYTWTATADGMLTVNVSDAAWGEYVYTGILGAYDPEGNPILDPDGNPVIVDVPYALTVSVDGNEVSGIKDVAVAVKANDAVVISVEILPAGDYNEVYAADVTVAAVLDPAGSETNPIEVNLSSELTSVNVAAGSNTYYAVSSTLNGMTLTINGDANTTVTVNGVAVEGENGVFAVVLDGTPANKVVVSNAGTAAASYAASIAYPDSGNPDTGDNTNVAILFVLAAVSVMGMAAVVTSKKRMA